MVLNVLVHLFLALLLLLLLFLTLLFPYVVSLLLNMTRMIHASDSDVAAVFTAAF